MTIIDGYQLLNEFFNSKTVFNLKNNKKDLIVVEEDEEVKNACLICSLNEMEKAGILRSCEVNGEKYWILYKSLESFTQTVEINSLVAAAIASVINDMCGELGADSEKCDPRNINEKDLKNLIYMASKVSSEELKK
jgi:hypothetical protein